MASENESPTPMNEPATGTTGQGSATPGNSVTEATEAGVRDSVSVHTLSTFALAVDPGASEYWKEQYSGHCHGSQPDLKRKASEEPCEVRAGKRQQVIPSSQFLDRSQVVSASTSGQQGMNEFDPITVQIKIEEGVPTDQSTLVTTRTKVQQQIHEALETIANRLDRTNHQAVQDYDNLRQATQSFGTDKCKAVDGKWKLPGFKTTLYNHQLLGVRWMCAREFHPHGPHGGILADQMGLGKTIQLLACMAQNPPDRKAKASKTLIIAPEKLLTQWLREIQDHCEPKGMRVMVYKRAGTAADHQVNDHNVIITNYAQIQRQAPQKSILAEIEELRESQDPSWKELVRDTSKACRYLPGKHRWVLTGTPMTNMTDEIFPYLDFLGTKFSQFSTYYEAMGNIENDQEQMEQLQAILSDLTLRRCVDAELMGAPILQIPRAHPVEVVRVELSPFEREVYDQKKRDLKKLTDRTQQYREARQTSDVSRGAMRRAFDHLRFFSSHPALVERTWYEAQEKQALADASKLLVDDEVKCKCFCKHCKRCGHLFCGSCFNNQLRLARKRGDAPCCPCCGGPVDRLKSGAKNCPSHQMDDLPSIGRSRPWRNPGDDDNGMQPRFSARQTNIEDESKQSDKEDKGNSKKSGSRKKGKSDKGTKSGKPKGHQSKIKKQKQPTVTVQHTRKNTAKFLKSADKTPWKPIPHSAKTKATIDLVNKWQSEAPNDKIIIFVQWISMLSILGRMLYQNGHRFVYLWGEMEANEQDKAITNFKTVPEIKIMLISVTCGAHGLNLTVANRAIVYDHWWHICLERQAFARVHRIGQTKEVHTAKIVAAGSVDEEILKRQDTKQKRIADVMDGMGQTEKLPISEVCELLGMGDILDFVVEDDADMEGDEEYIEGNDMDDDDTDSESGDSSDSSSDEDDSDDDSDDRSSGGSGSGGESDDEDGGEHSGSESD
ncbi:P-loop containing nucleoside triphosphate hydrolase protein [Apiosordaria backusii]|uniref:P-loop containing nucleoside triphosphate hydrolase protein n=1 Tax=Apiosordaria backusii TaxID=314023 RepID=A0AA40AIF9_9PEZI|nr:P-loop containing nucleoside triphosphate hydrolase protein [Apiosordaria backusii]